jgi:hypothetical protein
VRVSITPRSLFTPGKDTVPIVQDAVWAPGPVWTGAENLTPTGIWPTDRPARSQSLCRRRYPAHFERQTTNKIQHPYSLERNISWLESFEIYMITFIIWYASVCYSGIIIMTTKLLRCYNKDITKRKAYVRTHTKSVTDILTGDIFYHSPTSQRVLT